MKEVELHPSQIVKERGTSTRLGCLSRCDGSAVLMSELGSCCVGIIGPVEAKEKDQDPIKMICQVTLHPPSGTSAGPTHRQMEETIRGVIEATVIRENNPRCQLNVTIQPFNTNFCLAPLINCTILALLDAGVPLSFIASAGTACLVEDENDKVKIIQSPTWDELESSIASVQAVFNKSGKLLAVQSEGDFRGELISGLHKSANDSKNNFSLFQTAVTKLYS